MNRDPARLGRSGRPRRRAPRPSAPCPGILPAPHSVTRAPLADHAPDAGDAARRRARVLVRPPPPWSGSSQTASHIRGLMWPPAGGPPPRSGRRSRPTAAWACCIGRGGLSISLLWHDIGAHVGAPCAHRLARVRCCDGPQHRSVAGRRVNYEMPSLRGKN